MKVATLSVGLAMAIGVGVAVGSSGKAISKADALNAGTYKITFASGTDTDTNKYCPNNLTSTSRSFYSGAISATGSANDASGTPTYNSNSSELRFYYKNTNGNGSSATFSFSGITVVSIKVTASSSSYAVDTSYKIDGGNAASGTWSDTTMTISNISATSSFYMQNVSTSTQLRIKSIEFTVGGGSDWETTAIAISTSAAISKTIYNTTESFPSLSTVTVTKTEHDKNGQAADRNVNVTSSSTLHWVEASDVTQELTLPLSNGEYNAKVWASVENETLTSKDNATEASKYISVTLTVIDEPLHAEKSTFTAVSGDLVANIISFTSEKGDGTTAPAINSSRIRLYKPASGKSTGGTITFTASTGYKMAKVVLKSNKQNSFKYSIDGGSLSSSAITSTTESTLFVHTLDELDASSVQFVNVYNDGNDISYMYVEYYQEAVTTPTIVLNNTPSEVNIGTNTAQFTVSYFSLTTNFSVSVDSEYLEASYTGAKGTGEATVYLSGKKAVNDTTISVASTGATTQSFHVSVSVLPVLNASVNSMTWGSTSYATSPHTLTWNTNYQFVVSSGQLNSNIGYLGTNSNSTNQTYARVSNDNWTLKGTSINQAIVDDQSASWSTFGQAIFMSNFGVVKPTEVAFNIGTVSQISNVDYSGTYYILASTNSGDSWSIISSGSIAKGNLSWSGSSYTSNTPIQFAFVTTSSTYGTVSDITIKAWGDSYATTKVLDSIYVSGTPVTSYVAGQAFSFGSAKLYARYTDSTTYPDEDITSSNQVSFSEIKHGTTSVRITYLEKYVDVNVSVSDVGDIYKKVTSTNELLDGSKVVIGSTAATSLMGAQGNNNRVSEGSEPFGYYDSGDVSTYSINTAEFTLDIIEENDEVFYTFKDSSDKYLYAVATSNNYLRSQTTLTDAAKWHIEFDSNVAGKALITTTVNYEIESVATDVTKYMGGNASAYGCYTNSNNAISIYIDVENNVDLFVSGYMHTDIPYDADPDLPINNTGNCESQDWYVDAKAVLVGMGSDYISEFQTNDKYADALARYNAWATHCKDSTPFAGNGIVLAQEALLISALSDSNGATLIIVVASIVSLTAIGGYFLFKKKKQF